MPSTDISTTSYVYECCKLDVENIQQTFCWMFSSVEQDFYSCDKILTYLEV